MKKRMLLLSLALLLVASMVGALAWMPGAEEPAPELSIAYCNLSFRDTVCIKYAVSANVPDVKILIWTSPDSEYTVGTQDDEITEQVTQTINGTPHLVFDYTKLAAKQMTDVVYARAYANVDGVDYYSEINKYSILQYAYNKLGKTATASTDEELKEMLTHMLAYGAAAQKYLNDYKADRLATADWYQVKLTAGVLDDKCTHGLYLPGDKVTLIAPPANEDGIPFSHWQNSAGDEIATSATYELTVGSANEIYTPIYAKKLVASEGLEFTLNEDGMSYSVTGIGTCTDTDIVIPDTHEGLPVTVIGDQAFDHCTNITSVFIPDSITAIQGCAFWHCTALERIAIPESVLSIGMKAFYECSGLEEISIAYGVQSIDLYAFSGCSSLASITIPDSVTTLNYGAFVDCTNLTSVTLSNNLDTISYSMFGGCKNLQTIIIPDNVKQIGHGSFSGCESLTSITIPANVTRISISQYNFYNCKSLTSINVDPRNETYASKDGNLYSKDYSELLHYAPGKPETTFALPDGVKKIGDYAFCDCENLRSVTIPDSVAAIGQGSFRNCTNLRTIIVPNSVTSIDSGAFRDCTNLRSITLPFVGKTKDGTQYTNFGYIFGATQATNQDTDVPQSLTSVTITGGTRIDDFAFRKCKYIENITISDSITSIGEGAFGSTAYYANAENWENGSLYIGKCLYAVKNTTAGTFTVKEGTRGIAEKAFNGCANITDISIPDSVVSIGINAFPGCTNLSNVSVATDNEAYESVSGNLYTKGCKTLMFYARGKADTAFAIPDSVTRIEDYAISECANLTSITLPQALTHIGERALLKCANIENITIPKNVVSIGAGAFSGCKAISTFTFEDVNGWYRIGDISGWLEQSGGVATDVSNNSQNYNLVSSTANYWYKLTNTNE